MEGANGWDSESRSDRLAALEICNGGTPRSGRLATRLQSARSFMTLMTHPFILLTFVLLTDRNVLRRAHRPWFGHTKFAHRLERGPGRSWTPGASLLRY